MTSGAELPVSAVRRMVSGVLRTLLRVVPKNPHLMVVYGLTESEDGALSVQTKLVERGYEPVRLTNNETSLFRAPSIVYRRKTSLGGLWSFLRAGVVFSSHELYGGMASGAGQRLVLFWHGEVLKPVGLLDGGHAVPADVAPVCSELGRAYRCAEFGLHPGRVPVLGAPRNDRLLGANPEEARRRLDWPSTDVIWLWLPTYRVAVRGGRRQDALDFVNGLPFDASSLDELDQRLAANSITLVLKPHPLSEQTVSSGFQRLRVLTQSELDQRAVSLYEALAAADGLVTDISSVWLDFILTGRPIVYAFPDLEVYRTNRGFNLEPYEGWVCGPVVTDPAALVHAMHDLNQDDDRYAHARRDSLRRFHRYVDSGSTDRLLDDLGLDGPR